MRRLAVAAVASCLVIGWIAWPQVALSHGAMTTTVLFDREIVRILNNHCVMCHSEQSLSVPLSTYEETWTRGRSMRTEVLRRHMPPWPAVAGYGQFLNDNGLTVRETQFIVSWVEGLGPRNSGTVFLNVARPEAAPPEVRASAHVGHWQLGDPGLSRQLAATRIEAGRADFVQRILIDPALTSERRVRALEYMPGDRRVVRAAVFSVEGTGQWLGSWTPWYGYVTLPPGLVTRLPARSRIVADVYYRGTTETITDRGTLGLFFDETTQPMLSSDLVLEAKSSAASGATVHTLRATTRITRDTHVWALRPDVVPGVTSIEVSARSPDGGTEILLLARNPSIEWPTPYIMKTPRLLRRGTEVFVVAQRQAARDEPRTNRMSVTISRY
jgi:hypothetical protein